MIMDHSSVFFYALEHTEILTVIMILTIFSLSVTQLAFNLHHWQLL